MGKGTTQKDINARERARLALQLRKQGYELDEIARQCGYADKSGAWRAIRRELDSIPIEDVKDVRTLELARLDHLYTVCYKRMEDAKNKDPLWAVDRLLAISERRARLLGLDTPVDAAMNANLVVVREVVPGYLGLQEPKP